MLMKRQNLLIFKRFFFSINCQNISHFFYFFAKKVTVKKYHPTKYIDNYYGTEPASEVKSNI